jgi:polar amino acid transport system substrate-binding protein
MEVFSVQFPVFSIRVWAAFDLTEYRTPPAAMRHLLALLALALPAFAADKLIVGMELAYPPFEMRDNAGNPDGVSVDLAKALGEHLGRPVEIENIPFAGLIPALKTAKIDLVISSMTATPERALAIDFSEPYLRTGLCLLVPAGSDIQSVADADHAGRAIAVVKGTTGHLYASQKLKRARVIVFDRPADCVLEVAQKKSDAFIIDQMTAIENARRTPDTVRALLHPFQEESWAIGLRKSRDKLREEVNAFLKQYRESGGFDRLGEKWFSEQKAEFKTRGVPFVF